MAKSRIILTGFMGTGKSAVGQELANTLSYRFIDTDLLVEESEGVSIPEIFKKEGEAHFRACEREMLKKALKETQVVVSTGGGAVIDPRNRNLMKRKGYVVCLSASPETILKRVSHLHNRPLLDVKDKLVKIREIISSRAEHYKEADCIIDTTSKLIEETVREIIKALHENPRENSRSR